MFGTITNELEVKVSATKAWAVYGTVEFGNLAVGKVFEAIDMVEGDGGAGTVLKITLMPGIGSDSRECKEKFTKVDNANMVKEAELMEGWFLDMGFDFYRMRIEIKENVKDESGSSCLLKLTIEYEVKEEFVANASLVAMKPLLNAFGAVNEYLLKSN